MNKITKAGVGVAAIAAVAAGALVISAYGPDRQTYTMQEPADKITFNSITDNPKGPYTSNGDERFFVEASEYFGDAAQLSWADNTTVEDGKEYVVHMYVHNDAASNLNLVAENVRAHVVLPQETASSITVTGMISSSNADPQKVWDETVFTAPEGKEFSLEYVGGTAEYTNCDETTRDQADKSCEGSRNPFPINERLFTEDGIALGYNEPDGRIPGCIAYAGWVSFHVKAHIKSEEPSYTVEKKAMIKGSGAEMADPIEGAKDGDTIVYGIEFKNTGNITLYDVNLLDILPESLEFQSGTTRLWNDSHNGDIIEDTIATEGGIYIGDYAPGATATVAFEAIVKEGTDDICGPGVNLVNTIKANASTTEDGKTRGDSVEDTAEVRVEGKVCEDEKHPNFEINKMVQKEGDDNWAEEVTVKAGETVRYRIQFKNTGDTTLEYVAIIDELPAHMNYVAGKTMLYNAEFTEGKTVGDEIVNGGLNIGNVEAGSEATIYFYATADKSLADDCDDSRLVNTVKGKYNNDDSTTKTDTADVKVPGIVCDVPEYPKTGAESKLAAIVVTATVATAASYIISRKK